MSIQAISIPKNPNISSQKNPKTSEFKGYLANPKEQQISTLSTGSKIGIVATTLAGVAIAMAATFKHHKLPLKTPKDFYKNLVSIKYNKDAKEVEWLVGRLAIGSVGGGLLGGAIFDKKQNIKAKVRESIIQLVGNIFTPLVCVAGGMRLFNKNEAKILDSMKFLKGKAKGIPSLIVSAACLITGILLGNKVGNTINKEVFHTKEERKIKASDMSPHIDDLCLAISLVAAQSKIGPIVSRFIPAALTVAGISTGFAQECPDKLNEKCDKHAKA